MTEEKLPNPAAFGYIKGRIVGYDEGFRGFLKVDSGVNIPCALFGGNAKASKKVSLGTQIWSVFPVAERGSLALKVKWVASDCNKEKEGQFFVRGRIRELSESQIFVDVWSVERQRDYLVILDGYLKAEVGQYWSFEAAIEGNKLVLVDGEMLAQVFNKDDFTSNQPKKEEHLRVTVLEGEGSKSEKLEAVAGPV
jgi:hypothetical protein